MRPLLLVGLLGLAVGCWILAGSPPSKPSDPGTGSVNRHLDVEERSDPVQRIEVNSPPVAALLSSHDGVYAIEGRVIATRRHPHSPDNDLFLYTVRIFGWDRAEDVDVQMHQRLEVANDAHDSKRRFGVCVDGESIVDGGCYELHVIDRGRRTWLIHAVESEHDEQPPIGLERIPHEWSDRFGARDFTIARLRIDPPWRFALSDGFVGVVNVEDQATASSLVTEMLVLETVWSGGRWNPGDIVKVMTTASSADVFVGRLEVGESALVLVSHLSVVNLLVDFRFRQ